MKLTIHLRDKIDDNPTLFLEAEYTISGNFLIVQTKENMYSYGLWNVIKMDKQ